MEQLTAKDTQRGHIHCAAVKLRPKRGKKRYSHRTQSAVKAMPRWSCPSGPQVGPEPPTSPTDTCPSSEMTLPVFQQSLSGPCSVSGHLPPTDTLLDEGKGKSSTFPSVLQECHVKSRVSCCSRSGSLSPEVPLSQLPQVPPDSWMSPKG